MMKAEALLCDLVRREDTSKHLKGQLGSPVSDEKSSLPVSWDLPFSNEKSSLPVSWDPLSVTKNHHFQSVWIPCQ